MAAIPVGSYCRICQSLFCCEKCRISHENKEHPQEIEMIYHEELMKSQCYICNDLQLPFSLKEKLPARMLQHIVHYHLPLKCDRCLKIFETAEDFALIGTCCKGGKEEAPNDVKENFREEKVNEDPSEKEMTPLTQMNLRWRRKSREFGKVIEEGQGIVKVTRTTSTPLQASFDSPLTMQMSSINYNSNSSESQFTPPNPVIESAQKPPIVFMPKPPLISPMEKKKIRSNNTPLRQTVMTKSIQRAIVANNNEQNKKYGIQQRRMNFDSTASSNEKTISLLKIEIDATEEPPEKLPKIQLESDSNNNSSQPLDLRLSPALRRDDKTDQVIPKTQLATIIKEEKHEIPVSNIPAMPIEEIQVVVVANTTITSFKSCGDETIATPKVTASSGNLLKKTISFEPPRTIEKTPVMLIVKNPRKTSDDSDEDDVFYTPRATPARRRYSMESDIVSFQPLFLPEEGAETTESPPKKKKYWNLVTSAIRRAADYLSDLPGKGANFVAKRRRYSSGSNSNESFNSSRDSASVSPLNKKRRILGRKPINRMLSTGQQQ